MHRVGPDLHLVALAWLYGYRWIHEFLTTVHERHPFPSVEAAAGHAGFLVGRFGPVLAAARRLDTRTWPHKPPPQPVAVAAFHRRGAPIRWFLFEPQLRTVVVADPGPGQDAVIEAMRAEIAQLDYGGPSPAVVVCPHIQVYPRKGARYARAQHALPDPGHWLWPDPRK